MKIIRTYITLIFGILLLAIGWQLKLSTAKPQLQLNKQQTALNFNNQFLLVFSTGQRRLISSTLWISTLLESDINHVKEKNDNSWMFLRFNTISEIDPLFLKNYQFGGQYLSIVKDDLVGAAKIFEKGLVHYPLDYNLNLNAGFLYAFETGEYDKAIPRYKIVSQSPKSPTYIDSLLAKLSYSNGASLSQVYEVVMEMRESATVPQVIEKFDKDLYAIKAELDLKCLNSERKENCNRVDYYGQKYLERNGEFFAPKPFHKYNLNINKKKGTN